MLRHSPVLASTREGDAARRPCLAVIGGRHRGRHACRRRTLTYRIDLTLARTILKMCANPGHSISRHTVVVLLEVATPFVFYRRGRSR